MTQITVRTQTDRDAVRVFRTSDPVEAEARYMTEIGRRAVGEGTVVITSSDHRLDVLPARYRIDADWPLEVCREHEPARRDRQWTGRRHQGLKGPTVPMIRAVPLAAPEYPSRWTEELYTRVSASSGAMEFTGYQLARLAGVDERTWRKWIYGERQCPPATYHWLLAICGLHPGLYRNTTSRVTGVAP